MSNSNELYHHGVMGQKWGVHRYQNPNGTLTAKGKARFNKVSNSKLLTYMDTRSAKRVLKKNKRSSDSLAKAYSKAASKAYSKGDKLVYKSEKYENTDRTKFDKYQGKAWKQMRNYAINTAEAQKWANQSKICDKKLDGINRGKIKAGKDFIIQRDLDIYFAGPYWMASQKDTMIERKR